MVDPNERPDDFDLSPDQLDVLDRLNEVVRRENRNLSILLAILCTFGLGVAMVIVGAIWWAADRSRVGIDLLIVGGTIILVAILILLAIRLLSRPVESNHLMP